LREEYIKRLVECDNPVEEVWRIMVELWDARAPNHEEYFKQEDVVSEFERELYATFFEIYDYLLEEIEKSRFEIEPPIIVMDGMSFREANLLVKDLKEKGINVAEYSYRLSALPSTTERFREKAGVKFVEVKSGKIPSELSFDVPIWVSYPDEILHHAAPIHPPHEAYEITRQLLLKILRNAKRGEITIISDHGYILIDGVWPLAKDDRKFLKERVFGSSRYVKVAELEQSVLEKLRSLPKDLQYVAVGGDYCCVRGRYFWPIEGYGKVVVHGGLSLMECIVPYIKVKL